jgi:flagellar biosynthesis/type III secretory pathway protein FliH
MLYRTMLDNEIMDKKMENPQYIPTLNEPNPMEQAEIDQQYMPFMGYPMMDGIYNPPTYTSQMPQQQYEIPEEIGEEFQRAPYDQNSYQQGYHQGHYQGYHKGYHHHKNNYPYYNPYPFFPFFPLFFGRE